MKNYKRLLAFLTVVLLILSTSITTLASAVPPVTATKAGKTVTISFEYAGIGGIYGIIGYTNPDMIKSVSIDVNSDFQGKLNNNTLAYFSSTPKDFKATLTVTVADTAKAGDSCLITIKYETTVDGRVPDTQVYQQEAAMIVIEEDPIVIDYTALKEQIARADGLTESEYTEESWSAMEKVYNEAKALIDNANTQKEVDDKAAELEAAIDNLEKKPAVVPTIDYSELKGQIARAESYEKDEYTEESWSAMEKVYNEAKALIDNANTQKEVDDKTAELKTAIDNLEKKPVAPVIDYSALKEQISIADGLTKDEYTEESWSAMEKVYNEAKALVDNATTQKEVDDKTAELKTAIDNLEKKPVAPVIDYTALKGQIARAESYEKDEYTEESWSAMEKVYNEAKALIDNANTQKEVDDKTAELAAAIKALEKKPAEPVIDYTELNKQIDIANGLNKEEYTEESWAAFEDALKAAIEARKSDDQTVVDATAKALEIAIANLVKVVKPGDSTNLLIFAIIAVIAALGTAVVVKKRK